MKNYYLESFETANKFVILAAIAGILQMTFGWYYTLHQATHFMAFMAMIGVFVSCFFQVILIQTNTKNFFLWIINYSLLCGAISFASPLIANSSWLTALSLIVCAALVAFTSYADKVISTFFLFIVNTFVAGTAISTPVAAALSGAKYFILGEFSLLVIFVGYLYLIGKHHKQEYHKYHHVNFNKIFYIDRDNSFFFIEIATALTISYYLFHNNIHHGIWVETMVLSVIKIGHDSKKRAWLRVYGTLIGSIIGAVGLYFISSKLLIASLLLPIMFFAGLSFSRSYVTFVVFLTMMIEAIFSLIKYEGIKLIEYRFINNLIGALIVIVIILISSKIKLIAFRNS